MKTRSHDLLTTSLMPIAIILLLFSGIYVPTHTSPTSPATTPLLVAAIGTHQDTPSVAETTQRSTQAHAPHVEPSATSLRQPAERSVPSGHRSSPSTTQASVSSVRPAVNETAHPQVGNGTFPASAPTTTTRPALTNQTNATTPTGPSLRSHTMTPLGARILTRIPAGGDLLHGHCLVTPGLPGPFVPLNRGSPRAISSGYGSGTRASTPLRPSPSLGGGTAVTPVPA